jgi:hypothetical protein
MSSEIQDFLNKLPRYAQIKFLNDQFKNKTGFNISEPTQRRIRKKIESGKVVEVDGSFHIIS